MIYPELLVAELGQNEEDISFEKIICCAIDIVYSYRNYCILMTHLLSLCSYYWQI